MGALVAIPEVQVQYKVRLYNQRLPRFHPRRT
jgi:hypothetical protein